MKILNYNSISTSNSRIITYGFYPMILFVVTLVGISLIHYGFSGGWFVSLITIIAAIIILIFEFIHPEYEEWKPTVKEVKLDLIHNIFSSFIMPSVFEAGMYGFITVIGIYISNFGGFNIFPNDWPLWIQMLLAVHIGDLSFYIMHRMLHEKEKLWPWHSVHHSPNGMYILMSGRAHPIQILFTFGGQMLLLWILGAGPHAMFMFGIFVAVNGMLQHCNVKMRFGFLNWIFATAELHRWHHSKKLEESNTNFGNNIILWDILMGTRFCPSDRLPHSEIGLPDGTNFPETYWGHILTPLNWEEIRYDGTTSNKIKEKIIEDSALLEVDKSV